MADIYYIDGYNVIYHSTRLRELIEHDFEAARDLLIEKVLRFCGETNKSAKIIFDGRGIAPDFVAPFVAGPKLEIIYSPSHLTADALIERAVYQAENRRALVVVTADNAVRDLCGGLGALTMRPEHFLATVRESGQYARTSITLNRQKIDRPARFEEALDDKTIQRLQALKKSLGGQQE